MKDHLKENDMKSSNVDDKKGQSSEYASQYILKVR